MYRKFLRYISKCIEKKLLQFLIKITVKIPFFDDDFFDKQLPYRSAFFLTVTVELPSTVTITVITVSKLPLPFPPLAQT